VREKLQAAVEKWTKDTGMEGCFFTMFNTRAYAIGPHTITPEVRPRAHKSICVMLLGPKGFQNACMLTKEQIMPCYEAPLGTEHVFDDIHIHTASIIESLATGSSWMSDLYVQAIHAEFSKRGQSQLYKECVKPTTMPVSDPDGLMPLETLDDAIALDDRHLLGEATA
jgi:hypothetical protein